MKSKLFRQEVIDKITGPDNLNTYIKILRPRVWLVLLGIAFAIFGILFFVARTGYPVWDLFFGN